MEIVGVCEKDVRDNQMEVEDLGGRPQIIGERAKEKENWQNFFKVKDICLFGLC